MPAKHAKDTKKILPANNVNNANELALLFALLALFAGKIFFVAGWFPFRVFRGQISLLRRESPFVTDQGLVEALQFGEVRVDTEILERELSSLYAKLAPPRFIC